MWETNCYSPNITHIFPLIQADRDTNTTYPSLIIQVQFVDIIKVGQELTSGIVHFQMREASIDMYV